jgi:hypothetical protein
MHQMAAFDWQDVHLLVLHTSPYSFLIFHSPIGSSSCQLSF